MEHVFDEDYVDEIHGINPSDNGTNAFYCVRFQTLFAMGSEWAATGKVILALPLNFRGNKQVITLPPNEVEWLK